MDINSDDIRARSSQRRRPSIRLSTVIGATTFVAGLALALWSGIAAPYDGWLPAVIVISGLIVGFLNITGREVIPFLVAATALIVIGNGDVFLPLDLMRAHLGTGLDQIVGRIALFAAPAALVNAVRAALAFARPGSRQEGSQS